MSQFMAPLPTDVGGEIISLNMKSLEIFRLIYTKSFLEFKLLTG